MESERRGDPEGCSGEGNGVREGGSGLCSPATCSSFSGYRPCGHTRNLGSGWMNALLSGLRDRTRRGHRHPVPSGLLSAHHRSAGQTGSWAWQPRGPAGAGSRSSSSGLSGPLPASSVSLLPFLGPKRMGSCRDLRLSRCSWRAARLGLSGPPCSGPARRRAGVTRVLCAPLTHIIPSPQAARASTTRHPCGWSRCAPRTRAGTSARCSCWTSSTTPSTTAAGCTSPSTVRACVRVRGPVRGACHESVCVRASERADVRGACLRDCTQACERACVRESLHMWCVRVRLLTALPGWGPQAPSLVLEPLGAMGTEAWQLPAPGRLPRAGSSEPSAGRWKPAPETRRVEDLRGGLGSSRRKALSGHLPVTASSFRPFTLVTVGRQSLRWMIRSSRAHPGPGGDPAGPGQEGTF